VKITAGKVPELMRGHNYKKLVNKKGYSKLSRIKNKIRWKKEIKVSKTQD
jgi:hypothetical protein